MLSEEIIQFAGNLFHNYEAASVNDFQKRSFPPETLYSVLDRLVENSDGRFRVLNVGFSLEGRPLRLVETGNGKTNVLLWSQMHGDESTGTMAIYDILNYLITTKDEKITHSILSSVKLLFLPMLNPDGAIRFQRRTVHGIDMNRDALALETPEAKILKKLQQEFKPSFGFNLHDQELSTVGTTKEIAAIGLLAPSLDYRKTENNILLHTKQLAAVFASVMDQFIPGKITKYDDAFEPRAFGDNMQRWGTSTLLVEAGHVFNDPDKNFIRKLNFVGILSSLYAIAAGDNKEFDIAAYENLPFNGKRAYDVIVRNILIVNENGKKIKADLGISYQVDTHSELPPKLVDVGDLHTFVGVREIEGMGKVIPQSVLKLNEAFEWEKYF
ncbi:MAG: M14 family zinc carboxypeptidase [Bacteroidota bacterium]|nr:M14 family zinc carboxypeptidase [Bacteroidota bacterium]